MIMTTTQKIIQIGSSKGVTIPSKQLKELGVDVGSEVRITIARLEKEAPHKQLMHEYGIFIEKYDETLKKLADK